MTAREFMFEDRIDLMSRVSALICLLSACFVFRVYFRFSTVLFYLVLFAVFCIQYYHLVANNDVHIIRTTETGSNNYY